MIFIFGKFTRLHAGSILEVSTIAVWTQLFNQTLKQLLAGFVKVVIQGILLCVCPCILSYNIRECLHEGHTSFSVLAESIVALDDVLQQTC